MKERIVAFCKEKGIAVTQFERLIGKSKGYVQKLDYIDPGVRTVKRIAEVMGTSVEELLKYEQARIDAEHEE